jgi:hypothetical protein
LATPVAPDAEADDGASAKSPTDHARIEWPQTLARWSQNSMGHEKRIIQEVIHLGGLMKGQLDAFERFTNESGLQPPMMWKSFRPPLTYHPQSFTDSLEDKPELYKYQVLSKRPMPLSLNKDVIDRPDALGESERDFGKNDIDKIFNDAETQKLLYVFDIKATRNEESEGFTWEIKDFQYKDWEECKDVEERKVKIKKSTEVLEWALYDSVSNPCTVLVLIC